MNASEYIEKRKKDLGFTGAASRQNPSDYIQSRKMELARQQTQPEAPQQPARVQPIVPFDARKTSFGQDLVKQTVQQPQAAAPGPISFDPDLLNPRKDFDPALLNRDRFNPVPEQPYEPKSIAQSPTQEALIFGLQGATQQMRDIAQATPSMNFTVPEYGAEDAKYLTPTQAKIAEIGGTLAGAIPGIGASYLTGGRLAANALARSAPTASRLSQEAVRGAGAGFTYGATGEVLDAAGDTRQDGSQGLEERLQRIATDTGLGAAGDLAFSAIGKGLRAGATQLKNQRDLRASVEEFMSRKGTLPKQERLVLDAGEITSRKQADDAAAHVRTAESYQGEMEKAIQDQYDFLKQSLKNRDGVEPGGVIRDESGEVIDRYGRISKNPLWYQEFYAQNGRVPTNAEMRQLAEEQVRKGFDTEVGSVPTWQPEQVQQIDDELRSIDDMLRGATGEDRSALQQVADTLKAERERLNKAVPKAVRQEAQAASMPIKQTAVLDDLLRSNGNVDVTPETIANTYNGATWYHGTGKADLTAEQLDPFIGNHESLFGQGIYLTDNPTIAEGYAKSRGKRSGTPTIYETNVKMDRVLDLEQPLTPDVMDAVEKSFRAIDYLAENRGYDPEYFTKLIQEEATKPDMTPEKLITKIREHVREFSQDEGISTNEFVENFQDLAINLKQAGYDGITHTGGKRTGKDPHRVLILLDPQNVHGTTVGQKQVTKLSPYKAPEVESSTVTERMAGLEKKESSPDVGTLGFSALGNKKGKFTNPEDTRTYIVSKTERDPIDLKDKVNQFYTNHFDNLQRINRFDKTVEELTGTKLDPQDRSYILALNQRGADMTARHILTEQLVDSQGNVIGPSLKSITEKIPRRSYSNFTDYLIAKHAQTRMARGERVYDKRTNMTPDKVEEKVAQYEKQNPDFTKIADQLHDWNGKMAQAWLVDTGIISQNMLDAWKEANPFWIPNKRLFTPLEKRQQATGARKGFANQNNPVKSYSETGSERPIIDPFESLIEYADRYVKTARRNEVMQTVIRQLEKSPDELADFAKVLERKKADPNAILGSDGIDALLDELDSEFILKKSDMDKDNVVSGLIDGQRTFVRVEDPALLEALTNLNPQGQNVVIESIRKVTNVVKLLTTGVNPIFSLTRNIFRDIPQAYIFSKTTNNPFRFAVDMLDAIVSTFGNKELYQRYKALGGGHSSPVAADRNLLAQSKRDILPQQKQGLGIIPRAYGALENLSNVVESAPRLAEFKRLTKAGGDSYNSRLQGLYEANDITTNFKRHGTTAKQADAIFLYLNAALQGLDKFTRAVKDNPKAVVAKSVGAISIPTIALYALNHNNPDYQKLSNYTKDNFFLIPAGEKDAPFIKIPKPRELGVPFGSLLERTMQAWFKKDPESFRDFSETVTNAFTPPGLPIKDLVQGNVTDAITSPIRDTIAGPLVDLASNKNFAGAPIVPGYLEGLSPRNQFDANTSEVSKKIGDVLNISPKQLDHLIRSYTGVVGQIGLPATTQGATIGGTLTKQVTADPVFSTDASKVFYDLKNKLDTQYRDLKQTGEVPKGFDDAARQLMGQVASDMGDYTKAIRAVDGLDMSSQEKKDAKRELTDQRNELAREAYAAVRKTLSSAK